MATYPDHLPATPGTTRPSVEPAPHHTQTVRSQTPPQEVLPLLSTIAGTGLTMFAVVIWHVAPRVVASWLAVLLGLVVMTLVLWLSVVITRPAPALGAFRGR